MFIFCAFQIHSSFTKWIAMLKSWGIILGCHRVKKGIKSESENKMLFEMEGEKKEIVLRRKGRKNMYKKKKKEEGTVLWNCQRMGPGAESKFT